jgi:protein-tyrosine phosphatase
MTDLKLEPPRHLPLTGAHNVRDLGGYATPAGETRWGAFFRADSLHQLTEADVQALLTAGVQTVIDLRHDGEVQAAPNRLAALSEVAYHHLPLIRVMGGNSGAMPPDLRSIYTYIVDECQDSLREAFSTMTAAPEGGILFHCSAGKDRTGVVAALLLGLVGVEEPLITADYALTTQAMETLRPVLVEQAVARGGRAEDLEPMLTSHAEDMQALLDHLTSKYGSLDAYTQQLGLDADQLQQLRHRLS